MAYMEQLKIIRDTLANLTSSVDALIMEESRDMLPEVAKLIDYTNWLETGKPQKLNSEDKIK